LKYRVIKKKLNRYITPLIRGLPKTNYMNEGYKNLTLLNGYYHEEGTTVCKRLISMPTHVKINAMIVCVSEILTNYKDVLLRIAPIKKGAFLRMRLLAK
jgi:hypothetical protein